MNSEDNKNGNKTPNEPALDKPTASQPEFIPPALDSALRTAGIDTRDPNVFRALQISLTMMFSGSLPLPPPEILKEYENIRPELVNKLVEWTEQQAGHRRSLEVVKVQRTENRYDRGQTIAASVAIGGLIISGIVGIFGNPWVAAVIAIVSVGGPTAAIWLARNIRSQSAQPQKPVQPIPPVPPAKM
jgi:uncharacterized membrane protein